MWLIVIGVLLLLLKLGEVGPVGDLSWWWVLSPFLAAVLWWEFADKTGYTKRKEMEKLDERKEARRQKSMVAMGKDEKTRRRR
ncbi:TIGR04438 family Trp-rich protein [Roseateles amylovorans]|uniref:TIGR04438 family Trp-rich protein n=1 Tax=Roseateles amylovorans TaxID=2978473 RepID=A0ABY6B6J9_9BURK|nr:TIGR04438 family Trp-rich protein [Roseateles amylovorans]UXH80130.1 TIGR04438 family Trp-rich protein [Roseateles amylovorans]